MKETTPIIKIYEEVVASQTLLPILAITLLAREVSLTQLFLYYKFHFRTRFNICSKKDDINFI